MAGQHRDIPDTNPFFRGLAYAGIVTTFLALLFCASMVVVGGF